MGCDIHAVWQKPLVRNDGTVSDYWMRVADGDWSQNRHYFLFAWLADVRNGYGVVPIMPQRGLPEDLEDRDDFGDHSFTWLTADEILTAARPDQGTLRKSGIVSAEEYAVWDKTSAPKSFCQGISGPGVKVAQTEDVFAQGGYTHVYVSWIVRGELDYFVDEVRRMRAIHGPALRLVMGFDS